VKHYIKILLLTAILFLYYLIASVNTSHATVPTSPPFTRIWSDPQDNIRPLRPAMRIRLHPHRDLDNYLGRFELLCQFLDLMQEHDPEDPSFGGLHEGEGERLWRIIETDNTQEAIRVWSEYADYFDDHETYLGNIEAAWTYTDSFPAWDEGPPLYYALHNCGWGLVAEMGYRTAYDDDSRREYGLACAEYLVENTPRIDPDMEDRLMPLVAGWAAGTLWDYGVFEDNEGYLETALDIASDVHRWIDADLDRLHDNEIWALCGGTAMWGVLRSLAQVDSSVATWSIEALEEMDVFGGRGDWNNSWNIWYAHAWIEAWRLIDDDAYLENAVAIVDSLLDQDGDGDGGIPATGGDPDDQDQSWVSAYTGWMGLRQLFNVLPPIDAAMVRLVNPSLERPWPVRAPLELIFELVNGGLNEQVDIPFRLRGAMQLDTTVSVEGWQPFEIRLPEEWTPVQVGEFAFTAYTDHQDDADRTDDTLRFTISILPVGQLELITLNIENEPVGCDLYFYHCDIDSNELFVHLVTDPEDGRVEAELMVGTYRVDVIPDFPYPRSVIEPFEVTEETPNLIDLRFEHPPVLLVDRDIRRDHASYYEDALNATDRSFYRWTSDKLGGIEGRTDGFPTVIYFTGDRKSETVPSEDREEMARHLGRGGGLFVTGQDIADDIADDPFLTEVLHCRHLSDSMRQQVVEGVEGDDVLDGMTLLLFGNRGANNQRSKAGIEAVGSGVTCAFYRGAADTAAAVRWEEPSGGRGIFFAFGFEGISGQGGTTAREEVMAAVLDWLGTPQKVEDYPSPALLPDMADLYAYPNPANSTVHIRFGVFVSEPWRIFIFDQNGRRVRKLAGGGGSGVTWDCMDRWGRPVPSGMYYLKGYGGSDLIKAGAGRVILLR